MEWSYQLLGVQEQRLFADVSVFQGAFGVDDAVAVSSGPEIAPRDVPALLWSLVERSLVVGDRAPVSARYSLLETLRSWGERRLGVDGRLSVCRGRHAAVVLGRAACADAAARGSGAAAAFAELDRSLPDLRAAHRHLRAEADLDGLLRLSASLFWYGFSGIRSEVHGWITSSAHHGADAHHPLVRSAPPPPPRGSVATWRQRAGWRSEASRPPTGWGTRRAATAPSERSVKCCPSRGTPAAPAATSTRPGTEPK